MPDFELLEKEMRREMFDMQELMNRKMQEMDKKFMEDVFDTRAMVKTGMKSHVD